MQEKLLTIVVPTYNTEKYLPRCLDSLIINEQDMDKVEVLIVIDGSPDNSYTVAKKYEERYPNTFKVINKENGGHGSTINKGLELANGKYFKVLDSDDWFDKESYNKFLDNLASLDVDIVLTDYVREYIYEERSEIMSLYGYNKETVIDLSKLNINDNNATLFAMARITYKTDVLKKSALFLPEKIFYVDTIYAMTPLFYSKNVIYIDLKLYRYFIGREDQSVSLNSQLRNREHFKKVLINLSEEFVNHQYKLPENIKLYVTNFLSNMAGSLYVLFNKLQYPIGNLEAKELNTLIKKYNFIQSNNIVYFYNITPYWFFRLLLKIRFILKN